MWVAPFGERIPERQLRGLLTALEGPATGAASHGLLGSINAANTARDPLYGLRP